MGSENFWIHNGDGIIRVYRGQEAFEKAGGNSNDVFHQRTWCDADKYDEVIRRFYDGNELDMLGYLRRGRLASIYREVIRK